MLAASPAVANGTRPLVAHASQADAIAALLRLKRDEFPSLRLTIFGGAEALLVADALARARVPVVLSPPRPIQEMSFDAARAPFSPPLGAAVPGSPSLVKGLHDAGVEVSMTGAGGTTSNVSGICLQTAPPTAAHMVATSKLPVMGLRSLLGGQSGWSS